MSFPSNIMSSNFVIAVYSAHPAAEPANRLEAMTAYGVSPKPRVES